MNGIATNLHGKITKCATAGSFDDTEAVKQTRYFGIIVLIGEVVGRPETEAKKQRKGRERCEAGEKQRRICRSSIAIWEWRNERPPSAQNGSASKSK